MERIGCNKQYKKTHQIRLIFIALFNKILIPDKSFLFVLQNIYALSEIVEMCFGESITNFIKINGYFLIIFMNYVQRII